MATGPRRRACQTLDEKSEALRTIRAGPCVCMFACVPTLSSALVFQGVRAINLSLLTRRLERTCSISGLESMWGADVFMLNSIFESSLLLSNMSNCRWDLHTLSHALRFAWLFLVSRCPWDLGGYMETSFLAFFLSAPILGQLRGLL